MAVTSAAREATTAQVAALVAAVQAELDALVAHIVRRIRGELPPFRRIPAATLATAVRGTVGRALDAVAELRRPTPEELARSAAVGRERAEQGVAIDDVLHAYRISATTVWSRLGELARAQGADVTSVLAFSETLWLWVDGVMDVVAAAHREVVLERTREEQQQRDGFVFAVLLGGADPGDLRRDGQSLGVDAEQTYVPFRARALGEDRSLHHRLALAVGRDGGLLATLDHDLIGFAPRPPVEVPGMCVGIGPPARLIELAGAFAAATRACRTARAFGQEGVVSLADLSIRPAIVEDQELGEALCERYLAPLESLGRLGGELETTLRTWLDNGTRIDDSARALHVHANTLRHRLRRFEEATGTDLRRTSDLVELFWALEHRRLRAGA